jgi:hypothetical protein
MAGGIAASNIAEWNGTNWSALGEGISNSLSLVCDHAGNVFAGGVNNVAIEEWNGANWSLIASANNTISSLASDHFGNLYAGGAFTSISGISAASVAKWDGTNWFAIGSGVNNIVDALAFDTSGNLLVGGFFTIAGTNASIGIAEALLSTSSGHLSLSRMASGTNVITGFGTPGYDYALDFATNLIPPINWMPQTTNASSSVKLLFTNTTGALQGFFRTRYVSP